MAGRELEPLTPADLEVLTPYLDLARELKAEIDRITADPDADLGEVSRAIDDLPRQARAEMAGRVFAALTPEAQWSVLEHVFGDAELRDYLEAEREARLVVARRAGAVAPVLVQARSERRLDLTRLPDGHEVVVGLFRPVDVRAALALGSVSTSCARALTVRTTDDPGIVRVVDDRFNPRNGLFVTAEYDDRRFREEELPSHVLVRLGAADPDTGTLVPVLTAGARLDVERAGEVRPGRLSVGFVTVDDADLFTGDAATR